MPVTGSQGMKTLYLLGCAAACSPKWCTQVEKHTLVTRLAIPWRDLRILDPTIPSPSPSSIFIRDHAIVFNVEALRLIITKDEVAAVPLQAM